jgi:hypothetical protein
MTEAPAAEVRQTESLTVVPDSEAQWAVKLE